MSLFSPPSDSNVVLCLPQSSDGSHSNLSRVRRFAPCPKCSRSCNSLLLLAACFIAIICAGEYRANAAVIQGAVTVTSPTAGKTVASPFSLHASASKCGSVSTTAMGYSLDNSTQTTIFNANTINTSVSSTAGVHNLHVKCWAPNGVAGVTNVNLTVSSKGATGAQLTVSPISLSFGDVTVSSNATLGVTLLSSGSSAVTINSDTISGTEFTVSGATFPLTLSPQQAVSLNVKFAPKAGGAVTGTLSISSNSSSSPSTQVGLSGTGSQHSVSLAWKAPGSSGHAVASYSVYRATGSSSSYRLLSSTSQVSYVDSTVQGGTAYSYYVKSVDSSGTQSSPSNAVKVTVPTP